MKPTIEIFEFLQNYGIETNDEKFFKIFTKLNYLSPPNHPRTLPYKIPARQPSLSATLTPSQPSLSHHLWRKNQIQNFNLSTQQIESD